MHISPVLWQFLVKWLHSSALFPAEASTIAPWTDALYFFLLAMTLVGLVLVGATSVLLLGKVPQREEPGGHAGGGLDPARGHLDDYSAGDLSCHLCVGSPGFTSGSTTRRRMR